MRSRIAVWASSTALVGSLAASATAFAADLPAPVYVAPAPVSASAPVIVDWSGPYVGVHGGFGLREKVRTNSCGLFSSTDGAMSATSIQTVQESNDVADVYSTMVVVDGIEYNISEGIGDGLSTAPDCNFPSLFMADLNEFWFPASYLAFDRNRIVQDRNSWLFGAQLGRNWQIDNNVWGLEADFSLVRGNKAEKLDFFLFQGSEVGPLVAFEFGRGTVRIEDSINWLATLRGRAGFTFDRFLFYGTAGIALADFDRSIAGTFTRNPASNIPGTVSFGDDEGGLKVGFAIGAGAEAKLTERASLRLEYLFLGFGGGGASATFNPADGSDVEAIVNDFTVASRADRDIHLVRAAINFKFDDLFAGN